LKWITSEDVLYSATEWIKAAIKFKLMINAYLPKLPDNIQGCR